VSNGSGKVVSKSAGVQTSSRKPGEHRVFSCKKAVDESIDGLEDLRVSRA